MSTPAPSSESQQTSAQDAPVEWFRASTQYINTHRGKTFVVLMSGDALASDSLNNLVSDLSLLHSLGVKLVLVHGARPQIDTALESALESAQLSCELVDGLRVSPPEAIPAISAAVGAQSIRLEALLSAGSNTGARAPLTSNRAGALSLSRGNFITAMPIGVRGGVDFQHTGRVRRVDAEQIQKRLDDGALVLQSTLGYSLTGEIFNLSAEEVASQIAVAVHADKLIALVPEEGVVDASGALLAALSPSDAATLAKQLTRSAAQDQQQLGRTIDACVVANHGGVKRSHLIGYHSNGALIRELFTREGAGTLISDDGLDSLREASIDDVAAILALIRPLEADGTLVQRSRERLEIEIENFKVIELEGAIIACAALYRTSEELGEIACIAIHPSYRKLGLGARLLTALSKEAKAVGMRQTFVLTTTAAHWFTDHGYKEGALSDLPEKRQALYNLQRKSKILLRAV